MKEKSGTNTGIIVIIVLLVITVLGMGVYIAYDKGVKDSTSEVKVSEKEKVSDNNNAKETNNQPSKVVASRCTGTYSGSNTGTLPNGLTYDYKIKYVLNADGTFTEESNGLQKTGFYVINDNTVSIIKKKDTVGPREVDPYYYTSDYVIADDCSYILYNDFSSVTFKLNKQ